MTWGLIFPISLNQRTKLQLHIVDIKIKRFTYQESDYKLLVSTAFLIGLQYNLLTLNWDRTYGSSEHLTSESLAETANNLSNVVSKFHST